MGSVKIDFKTKEKVFDDLSYSSIEDLHKIINIFDLIASEKDKFNHGAVSVYLDLLNLIQNNDILKEFIDIQLGNKPMNVTDYNKSIAKVMAEKRGITEQECLTMINKEIKKTVYENKERWIDSILNYKWVFSSPQGNDENTYIEDEKTVLIDFVKKYIVPTRKYPEVALPEEIRSLVEFQKDNETKIKILSKIKNKTYQQKGELRKRINWRKSLHEDIKILEHHYGITNESEWAKKNEGVWQVKSEEVHDDHYILDQFEFERIEDIAKNCLTDKQYIVFCLYYENGFTQQEIAEILGERRDNIKNDLRRIGDKIKKNL